MKNLLSTKTGRTEDTRAIFHLDREGCITGLNRNAERITGRPLAELFGRPFQDLFAPDDDIASLTGLFDRLDPDDLPIRQFHLLELRQNGTRMEVLTTIMPIWGRDRSVTGALVTLDTNNEAFVHQTLLDSVPEGILTVNRNLEIVSFNAAARQITGWSLDEVLGQNCQLVFPPELCENKCLIRSAIEQAIPFSAQTIYMHHKDGHAFPLSLSTSPLFDLNGKVIGAVQTFHDCSASLLNDLILASVADGVFTIDHDRTITSFNRAAELITGWTQAEVVGKPCREIFHSSVCGDNCLLQMAIDRNSMFVDRAIFIKGKAGNSIPVTVSSSPLFDDFGNIIGGIETFRDNTRPSARASSSTPSPTGCSTVDRHWKITSFNRAAEEITWLVARRSHGQVLLGRVPLVHLRPQLRHRREPVQGHAGGQPLDHHRQQPGRQGADQHQRRAAHRPRGQHHRRGRDLPRPVGHHRTAPAVEPALHLRQHHLQGAGHAAAVHHPPGHRPQPEHGAHPR